jgi:type VI secretion system secreted protein VgrG
MRNVELNLASGDQLDVRTFNILETLSAAFRIDIVARATDDALDFAAIIGKPASFRVANEHGARSFTGVVADIAQTHVEPEGLSTYSLQLAPTLWLLTKRTGHRIFQHLSVPEIAKKLLGEWHIEPVVKLTHAYPKLPMRTQYGESDYDFLRRLLAEAGITFFFQTPDGEETKLVLSDAPQSGQPQREVPIPFQRDVSLSQGQPFVTDVNISQKVVPTKTSFRDYDFRRPRYALEGTHAAEEAPHPLLEDYHFAPGHALGEAQGSGEPVGDGEGAYRHNDEEAAARAQRRAEAHLIDATKIAFSTSLPDLAPGSLFSMLGHPHPEVAPDKRLLVTHSFLNGTVAGDWQTGGQAVPADRPYRPSATTAPAHAAPALGGDDPFKPLSQIVKPRISGLQSAVVTGPAGEDIHTDEHGRVKLQFPWDREGQFDDKSSPWVRVSQAWAGAGFGNVSIPRVGQEVLVGYQDGDPDHPVVVGRMHNSTAPVPYALPDNKTRTSLKSNSAAGANEITMEDKANGELLFIQAQKDLHKIVKNDELEHTQGSRVVTVDGDLIVNAKGKIIFHAGSDLVVKGGPNVKINPGDKPAEPAKPKPLSGQTPPKQPPPKQPPPKSGATGSNAILKKMNPGNRPQSAADAAYHRKLAEKYQADAIRLGQKYNVPPALVLGMMSRESNFGTSLDANGRGDHGHGYGILQVDDRTIKNPAGGPYSYEHLDQAMGIFAQKRAEVTAAHPGWTPEQQLAGAVSAYNQGKGGVVTQPTDPASWGRLDYTSTGHDYSMDTWARAQWYADNLKW